MKRQVVLSVLQMALWLQSSPVPAQADVGLRVIEERAYTRPDAQELVVHSESLDRNFIVVVCAPSGPFVDAAAKLAAVYALDGGYGIAGPIGQLMSWSGAMSPAYVVSVSYPPSQERRQHDLLHRTRAGEAAILGGGGAAFSKFLTHELRPYLERRYPLDPNRAVLFGHSSAGLFVANVLASVPDAFDGFIIASPSMWEDPLAVAEVGKIADRGRGRRVFIAAGEFEPTIVANAAQLAAALGGVKPTFAITNVVFADATHVSYWPDLVPAAFRAVLPPANRPAAGKRVAMPVAKSELERITGVYGTSDGRTITVTQDDSRVFAMLSGTPRTEILAESPQQFFAPVEGFDVTFTFEGPVERPADAVVLSLNGTKIRALRADN
jgi:predicted alpha/beta superfamily hydrolase